MSSKLTVWMIALALVSGLAFAVNEPTAANVTTTPIHPTLGTDLSCDFSYSSPLNYSEKESTYVWYKNGTNQNIDFQSIGKANLSVGEVWYCKVTPSDSVTNGTQVQSVNNVTVLSAVSNITFYVGGNQAFQVEGYVDRETSIGNWEDSINEYLFTCTPDSEGYCNVSLSVSSSSTGSLNLSKLEIYYEILAVSPEPRVTSPSAQPSIQGFGENITLRATITDVNGTDDISSVQVEISPPNSQKTNYSMTNITSTLWSYEYRGYLNSTYNYTIRANDSAGLWGEASGTFQVTATLEMKINSTRIVQGVNKTLYLVWEGGTGGVSEERTDYYRSGNLYVADGLSDSDIGLNGTIPNNNDLTSTTGWTTTTGVCKYNSSVVHKGSLSIMCEDNGDVRVHINNASFRGKLGGYVYFDSTGSSGNAAIGLLAVTSSGPFVGIQANPVTNPNVYCYEVGACNKATVPVIWNQWVPVLLNFTGSSIEFYYNGTFIHNASTSAGLESFKFLAHKNIATARGYFDQIWLSSGDQPISASPAKSSVDNSGSTNVSAYLLMKVQYWNGVSWLDNSVVLDDAISRRITTGNLLNLSSVWPGWNMANQLYGEGTYRAYAALTDENNEVISGGNGLALETASNFSICYNVTIDSFTEVANTTTQRDWRMSITNQETDPITNLTWNITGWNPAFYSLTPFNLTANESMTLIFNMTSGQENATVVGTVSSSCLADTRTLQR